MSKPNFIFSGIINPLFDGLTYNTKTAFMLVIRKVNLVLCAETYALCTFHSYFQSSVERLVFQSGSLLKLTIHV